MNRSTLRNILGLALILFWIHPSFSWSQDLYPKDFKQGVIYAPGPNDTSTATPDLTDSPTPTPSPSPTFTYNPTPSPTPANSIDRVIDLLSTPVITPGDSGHQKSTNTPTATSENGEDRQKNANTPTDTPTMTPVNLNFQKAVSIFFDKGARHLNNDRTVDLYNWKLPDWVIFINQDGAVTQRIIGSEEEKNPDLGKELFGEGKDYVFDAGDGQGQKMYEKRHIYALILADFPQFPDAQGNTTNILVPMTVSHTTLGRYYSTIDTLLNALAVAKAGAAETITSTTNETVPVTLAPAFDYSVILDQAKTAKSLSDLDDLAKQQKEIMGLYSPEKTEPKKEPEPSNRKITETLKKLGDISGQLNSQEDLKYLETLETALNKDTGREKKDGLKASEFLIDLQDLKNKDQGTDWRVKTLLTQLVGLRFDSGERKTIRSFLLSAVQELREYELYKLNKLAKPFVAGGPADPKKDESNSDKWPQLTALLKISGKSNADLSNLPDLSKAVTAGLTYDSVTLETKTMDNALGAVKDAVSNDVAANHWFLYFGMARLNLNADTVNRCALFIPNQYAAQFNSYHPTIVGDTFGNTDKEFGGISLALVNSSVGSLGFHNPPNLDVYVLAHLFLERPERPWSNETFSICVGPEINLSLPFNQFITGVDFAPGGNSGLGILLGANWYLSYGVLQPSWVYGINYFL